jgi:hypothetical protein
LKMLHLVGLYLQRLENRCLTPDSSLV